MKTKLIFYTLLYLVISAKCLLAETEVELLKVEINPSEIYPQEKFELSCSLKITEKLEKDCFLFLHLEGPDSDRFVNADITLARPTTKWKPNERIDLGPFSIFIPLDLPAGDYKIKMGLSYAQETPLGIRYIKIPYSNPEIKDWQVGKIKVKKLPLKDYKEEVILTLENGLEKFFPEKNYFNKKIKENILLYSASGEVESFQLVIIPQQKLEDIEVEITDLKDEKNKNLIKKENFKLYKVGFVKTKKPYYNTLRVGLWPDPLIPLRGKFMIEKDKVQPIWINIYVPPNTPQGNYQGKIIVKAKNLKPKELNINLRVFGFSLPKESHLKTGFDFYEYLLNLRYPKKKEESEREYKNRLEELKKAYYLDMLSHRINPIHNVGNPKFLGKKDDRYLLDFEEFDKKVEFYQKHGQICFGIAQEWPWGYKGNWTDSWYGYTDEEAVVGVFREYGKHLEEKNWLDSAYAYIFDETLHRVKEFTFLIHKGHPKIKNLVTLIPQENYPDVDIWCVRINDLDKINIEEYKKNKKEIWTYVAGQSNPFPSLNLDLPSIEYRIIPWICWKYNLDGLIYWCVNWWHNTDPWQDPMSFPQQNGNGYLYYPDPEGKEVIGSIRLEVLREGLEDYEYLYILKEKLEKIKKEHPQKEEIIKKIETLLKIPQSLLKSADIHTYEGNIIYELKEEMGNLIETTNE